MTGRHQLLHHALQWFTYLCLCLSLGGNISADTHFPSADDLKRISPQASDELIGAFQDASADMQLAGIDSRLKMAHFVAQLMTETAGLRSIDVSLDYSEATLHRLFNRQIIAADKIAELASHPQQLGNWINGDRFGNRGRSSDDGWLYRASGFIPVRGRANYRQRGSETGIELEQQPELARDVRQSLGAAIEFWRLRGINRAADDNDHRRVRTLVSGSGTNGAAVARLWFNRAWRTVFSNKPAAELERPVVIEQTDAELLDEIMLSGGLLTAGFVASNPQADEQRRQAILNFQAELGLVAANGLDFDTELALLDPREWRHAANSGDWHSSSAMSDNQSVVFNLSQSTENVASIAPATGSGELLTSVNLPQSISESLRAASANYAEYEMGGRATEPSLFKPFSVIGEDDRVAVTDTRNYPARAIVQILLEAADGSEFVCSGAMVSKDTVLTAAHCIHGGTPDGEMFTNFKIIPALNVGAAPFGVCQASQAFVLNGWLSGADMLEIRYFDLGALKLDCDVGLETGWLGIRTLEESELGLATVVHGYAKDRAPPGRQWVSTDELRLLWEQKGFYDNDTFGGTSGSPVLVADEGNIIIGVHTNGTHGEYPWKQHNAFTRITEDRLQLISQWIEDQP